MDNACEKWVRKRYADFNENEPNGIQMGPKMSPEIETTSDKTTKQKHASNKEKI